MARYHGSAGRSPHGQERRSRRPVIVADSRTTVQRLFVMFLAEAVSIRAVHVFDGSGKVQEINDLDVRGEHRSGLDGANTFDLAEPHTVLWGMGLTVRLQADIGFDTDITTRFILAGAGGDFLT